MSFHFEYLYNRKLYFIENCSQIKKSYQCQVTDFVFLLLKNCQSFPLEKIYFAKCGRTTTTANSETPK